MQDLDFYQELGLRSRVFIYHGRIGPRRGETSFIATEMAFFVYRDDGDRIAELREFARIKIYEAGFPLVFRGFEDPWSKEDETIFGSNARRGPAGIQSVLIDTLTAPYMETTDWRDVVDRKLTRLEQEIEEFNVRGKSTHSRRMASVTLKCLLQDIATISSTEMYLDEYVKRRQALEAEAKRIVKKNGLADPDILDGFRKMVLERYVNSDPLNLELDTLRNSIDFLANLALPEGYYVSANKTPKSFPKQI